MSKDTPDGITLVGLKYAELLGKPLTKGLYLQLPKRPYYCCPVKVDESHEAFCWDPALTIQGKINWCSPECEAETNCTCETNEQCRERRDPRCRQKRGHQHLLLSVNGGLCQGFVYLRFNNDYEDIPWRQSLCGPMNPICDEQIRLQQEQNADRSPRPDAYAEWHKEKRERESRLAVIEKTVKQYERTAHQELHTWLDQALAALPVILLRG